MVVLLICGVCAVERAAYSVMQHGMKHGRQFALGNGKERHGQETSRSEIAIAQ